MMPAVYDKSFTPQYASRNPHCGCALEDPRKECFNCTTPGQVEVRLVYPPTKCVKPHSCNFAIPAVNCHDTITRRPLTRHTYDLTVDEPGPNDSYGLNGLNWWDWTMDEITSRKLSGSALIKNDSIPDHPYLHKDLIPGSFPNFHCTLPIDCYSRTPGPMYRTPFMQPVNYNRNWRCCSALPPPPWKPAKAVWATNQHL